jgi:hypothetical protein
MMAPAFTETENLQFSINMADNSITPAGLAAFAPLREEAAVPRRRLLPRWDVREAGRIRPPRFAHFLR